MISYENLTEKCCLIFTTQSSSASLQTKANFPRTEKPHYSTKDVLYNSPLDVPTISVFDSGRSSIWHDQKDHVPRPTENESLTTEGEAIMS